MKASAKKRLKQLSVRQGRVAGGQIGERRVQSLRLYDETYWSVRCWVHARSTPSTPAFVGDIYDEALVWFFEYVIQTHYVDYFAAPLPSTNGKKRALWVDSRLLQRAGEYAKRDRVYRNRVVYTAIILYLQEFAPIPTDEQIKQAKRLKASGYRPGRPRLLGRRFGRSSAKQ